MDRALGEIPDEPRIHGPEQQIARLGLFARAGHVLKNPADFRAGKIGVEHEPRLFREQAGFPCSRRLSQKPAVRRSCQTMALYTGAPVLRFQTTVVSRWLAMPTAATSEPVTPACRRHLAATTAWLSKSSLGLCSTQPG